MSYGTQPFLLCRIVLWTDSLGDEETTLWFTEVVYEQIYKVTPKLVRSVDFYVYFLS